MVDATKEFFADLEDNTYQPLLEKISGLLRFELDDGKRVEQWHVDVRNGNVTVAHNPKSGDADLVPEADCVMITSKRLFDNLAAGRKNAMASVLRGELVVDGDIQLLLMFQRVLPSPPGPANVESG